MNIRRFKPADAEFCRRIRRDAFIKIFTEELTPEATTAGADAYEESDYLRMAEESEFFIIEDECLPVGFFTIKKINAETAEIPLIYIELNQLGRGIGKYCQCFVEDWISSNWPRVDTLFVDTIIPAYNSGFYRKAGFSFVGEGFCMYPGLKVKAQRFAKKLRLQDE